MAEVILNPILYDEPSYEENALEDTEVLPAWMKLEEEDIVLQDGGTETSDVEFKHILFAHVSDHLLYGDDICLVILQIRTEIPHI